LTTAVTPFQQIAQQAFRHRQEVLMMWRHRFITDSQHHVFRIDGATYSGPPTEKNESDRIEWIPLSEVRGLIDHREIVNSGSLVGLLYLLMDEAIR
jgi:hypothetical protein